MTSDPKTLNSLVELEKRAISQSQATLSLKSQALASPPTRALLNVIKTHRTNMETTLAAINTLWFPVGSLGMTMKEGLKMYLQKNIEDVNDLKGVLLADTGKLVSTRRIIGAEPPSEDLSCGHTHTLTLATDEFIRSLAECDSLLLRSLFELLVQDTLDHSTRKLSNIRLKSLKEVFRKSRASLSNTDEQILRTFPSDIRVARKLLGVPKTITYACCPACSSTYPSQDEDGIAVYPYDCTSEPC